LGGGCLWDVIIVLEVLERKLFPLAS